MVVRVIQIARLLIIPASRHRSLVFENLALRQQLAVYQRTRPKRTVCWSDRLFWVGLRRAWPDWTSALVIVRPATVIAWHRRGFAWYWIRRSRPKGGRPPVDAHVRRLTREMARANPLWGAPRIHGELLKLGFDVSELHGLPADAPPADATFADLADVPREPSRLDRRHRLLRGANAHLPDPLCPCYPGLTTDGASRGDSNA